MSGYDGVRVLITGGSKGIGRALALKLAERGAHVAIAARGREALDQTLAELRARAKPDRTCVAVAFDAVDPDATRRGVAEVLERLGGVDIVVASSGASEPGYVQDLPDAAFRRMFEVNYLGHVHVVRALLPHFLARRSGRICLISSMVAVVPLYGFSAYAPSKVAVTAFAEVLRQEMAPHGVTVQVFHPSTTETPGLLEENAHKPKDVWLLEADSAFSYVHSAEQVADALLALMKTRRFEAVLGPLSWFVMWFTRHFPRLARVLTDREIATARAKAQAQGA